MTRAPIRSAKHDEDRVRVLWNRHAIYDDLHAIAVGGRVIPGRVAFFDRETGIAPVVPKIVEGYSVRAWSKAKSLDNLATMAMSVDHKDRVIAQTIIATRSTGLSFNLTKRDVHVYLLSTPEEPGTKWLPGTIPLGNYVPGAGHANLAVTWDDLMRAEDCAHLRAVSEGAEA